MIPPEPRRIMPGSAARVPRVTARYTKTASDHMHHAAEAGAERGGHTFRPAACKRAGRDVEDSGAGRDSEHEGGGKEQDELG